VAWNAKLPDTFGVFVNVVPSATPATRSNVEDVDCGAPAHVPFKNQLNVTVPVGVPSPPVTVALSCTVEPAGTAGRYVAFAPDGGRASFAGSSPPEAPTLLLAESEIDFDDLPSALEGGERTGASLLRKGPAHRRGARIEAPADPPPGSVGTKVSGVDTSRHTYVTAFHVDQDFDTWGSMEIEIFASVDGSYSGCQRFTGIDSLVYYYLPAPGSAGSRKIAYAVPTGSNEVDIAVYEDDDTGCVLKGGDDYVAVATPTINAYGFFVSDHGWASVRVETESTTCGDSVCEGDESSFNCCADCASCGDGTCQSQCGETGSTCSTDCYTCGNSVCETWKGEDVWNCSQDCGTCGNGWCEVGENEFSCPPDCCPEQEICPE
jgi:hypothetical protein